MKDLKIKDTSDLKVNDIITYGRRTNRIIYIGKLFQEYSRNSGITYIQENNKEVDITPIDFIVLDNKLFYRRSDFSYWGCLGYCYDFDVMKALYYYSISNVRYASASEIIKYRLI